MRIRSRGPAGRAGFTLVEVLVAVTMMILVFAAASPLFQQQARMLDRHASRADAIQTARFAAASIERELRIAGPPNEIEEQPLLVQADPYALTVNVDLNSRDTTSASAVYFDPDIDPRETQTLTPARAVTLPRSSITYPAIEYTNPAGVRSDAETISYWVSRDQSASRTDVYTLWRRINDGDSAAVARDIVVRSGRPFFEYLQTGPGDTLRAIAANRLPAFHTVIEHGATTDVGTAALVDSVREVRVTAEVLYSDPRLGDTTYTSQFRFRLLNAGLIRRTTCGTEPRAVPSATVSAPGAGVIRVSWTKSVDDGSGEQDVRRYTLYRRPAGTSDWGEPFRAIQARDVATYDADDTEAKTPGDWWEYAVIAQDCTPTNSEPTVTSPIQIP